jgi:putative membrane protein
MPMWANQACQNAGWGSGMMFHGVISLLLLSLGIAGIIVLFRIGLKPRAGSEDAGNRPPALDVLERRYASGEIDREEYLQKKADLGA